MSRWRRGWRCSRRAARWGRRRASRCRSPMRSAGSRPRTSWRCIPTRRTAARRWTVSPSALSRPPPRRWFWPPGSTRRSTRASRSPGAGTRSCRWRRSRRTPTASSCGTSRRPDVTCGPAGEDIAAGAQIITLATASAPTTWPWQRRAATRRCRSAPTCRSRSSRPVTSCGPAGTMPRPGELADSNSVMLAARLREEGIPAHVLGVVRDDPVALEASVRAAVAAYRVVLVLAGSSKGTRDHTARGAGAVWDPRRPARGAAAGAPGAARRRRHARRGRRAGLSGQRGADARALRPAAAGPADAAPPRPSCGSASASRRSCTRDATRRSSSPSCSSRARTASRSAVPAEPPRWCAVRPRPCGRDAAPAAGRGRRGGRQRRRGRLRQRPVVNRVKWWLACSTSSSTAIAPSA